MRAATARRPHRQAGRHSTDHSRSSIRGRPRQLLRGASGTTAIVSSRERTGADPAEPTARAHSALNSAGQQLRLSREPRLTLRNFWTDPGARPVQTTWFAKTSVRSATSRSIRARRATVRRNFCNRPDSAVRGKGAPSNAINAPPPCR